MSDLDLALGFIFHRIDEEARRSGQPLNQEERVLLQDLPTEHIVPDTYGDPALPTAQLRDVVYERLCAIAKAAHQLDQNLDSGRADNWEFAANVTKLNGHPAAWLLDWAGVRYRTPWWDRLL